MMILFLPGASGAIRSVLSGRGHLRRRFCYTAFRPGIIRRYPVPDGRPGRAYARLSRASAAARRHDRGKLAMGILSWFRSLRSADIPDDEDEDQAPSFIKYRYEDPSFEPTERAAAADVAAVEEDAKYFGSNSPASQDEL